MTILSIRKTDFTEQDRCIICLAGEDKTDPLLSHEGGDTHLIHRSCSLFTSSEKCHYCALPLLLLVPQTDQERDLVAAGFRRKENILPVVEEPFDEAMIVEEPEPINTLIIKVAAVWEVVKKIWNGEIPTKGEITRVLIPFVTSMMFWTSITVVFMAVEKIRGKPAV